VSDDHYVVKLVTDFELLVNIGEGDGAKEGRILQVLDPRTQGVIDPKTGEDLGSVERQKARVAIEQVGERMSLCRVMGRRPGGSLSAVSTVMSGSTPVLIKGSKPAWPEGVSEGDPVVFTGLRLKTP
jgi:hypothetical protein